jgi:YD repeat-containing protein
MTLAEDTVGGTKIRYTYDWQGRRLQREDETSSSNGPKRRYYFHGLTPIYEQGATYNSRWGYIWGSNARYNTLAPGQYGHIVVQRDGTTDVFLHYDHVGNVVAESNTSGAFAALHEQDAFGRPVLSSAASGWDDNSTHMTTKPWDADIGMSYFFQRWYSSEIGQFTCAAPNAREREHVHRIALQCPLMFTDPAGTDPLYLTKTFGSEARSLSMPAAQAQPK